MDLTYSSDLFPDCKSHTPFVNTSIHEKDAERKEWNYGLDLRWRTVSDGKSHTPSVNTSIHEKDAERKEWTMDLTYGPKLFPVVNHTRPSWITLFTTKAQSEKNGMVYGLDLLGVPVSSCKSHTPSVNTSIHDKDAERKEWNMDLTYSPDLVPVVNHTLRE